MGLLVGLRSGKMKLRNAISLPLECHQIHYSRLL
jgi:hypothetical protein